MRQSGSLASRPVKMAMKRSPTPLSNWRMPEFAGPAADRTRSEMRALITQLEVRRGLLRLAAGQKLITAPEITAADLRRCEQTAHDAIERAEALNDFELRWKAEDFRQLVEDRRQALTQADRDNRLEEVRQIAHTPGRPPTLIWPASAPPTSWPCPTMPMIRR